MAWVAELGMATWNVNTKSDLVYWGPVVRDGAPAAHKWCPTDSDGQTVEEGQGGTFLHRSRY